MTTTTYRVWQAFDPVRRPLGWRVTTLAPQGIAVVHARLFASEFDALAYVDALP